MKLFRCLLLIFNHVTTGFFCSHQIIDYILEDELRNIWKDDGNGIWI
jgi:hypothetical protein